MAANRIMYGMNSSGAGFTNDLWETLTYGEFFKHEFFLILRTLE